MNAISRHVPDLARSNPRPERVGKVSLVGAGPGAADLLTLRALKVIESADVVYYDSLVGDGVLNLIKPGTKKVFVGKRKGSKTLEQSAIIELLRNDARAGLHVVRLKGGDAFIFGRGGEELLDLRADDIEVDVIPGVTSAGAAAAEHGIPLTHRDVATSVTFATGHAFDATTPDLNADVLSKGTLVIYMGISNADEISAQLQRNGACGSTKVAIIERASLPGQRLTLSSLSRVGDDIRKHQIVTPALLIVGDVAALGQSGEAPTSSHTKQELNDSFAWVHHPMG